MNAAPDGAAPGTSKHDPSTRTRRRINVGLGRLLIFVYGLFALSAGARALVQLATKFHEAPLAYVLSAIAALIYIVATVCLARSTVRSRRLGIVCVSIELVGVIIVGSLSLSDKSAFPDATVWSGFGSGYGYVPLVLPILGLWWLLRGAQPATSGPGNRTAADPLNRGTADTANPNADSPADPGNPNAASPADPGNPNAASPADPGNPNAAGTGNPTTAGTASPAAADPGNR